MNINQLKVGLVGGTGEEGRGLALRWAIAGAQVSIGSRTPEKAKTAADELNQILETNEKRIAFVIGSVECLGVIAPACFVLLCVLFCLAVLAVYVYCFVFSVLSISLVIFALVVFELFRLRLVHVSVVFSSEHLNVGLLG